MYSSMLKATAVCCILLPAVCHAACASGTATCGITDEAALVQREMLLAQKAPYDASRPAGFDLKTVSKHVSEALSLQYGSQASNAKLEMVKRFDDEFKPVGDQILAATDAYKSSEHSEADFKTWYAVVSEGLGKTVSSVGFSTTTAEAEAAEAKEAVVGSLDSLEQEGAFADKVTKFATASQRSQQGSFLAAEVKKQNKHVMKAMDAYQESTKGSFNDEEFGKTFGVINTAVTTLKSSFGTLAQVYEQKVKGFKDASLEYTAHSAASLNHAVSQLVAVDKGASRTERARKMAWNFQPLEDYMFEGLTAYVKSKHSQADLEKFDAHMSEGWEKIESMVRSLRDLDVHEEGEARDALIASLDNLGDEGELAAKIVEFSTTWGRRRLQDDLLTPVVGNKKMLMNALHAFEEKSKDGYDGPAFGKVYQQLITSIMSIKGHFGAWAAVSESKLGEMQHGELEAFTKQ